MSRTHRLLLCVLCAIILGGGIVAFRLWRQQTAAALAATSVPALPDLSRWPEEFRQRLRHASADVPAVDNPAAPLGELARLYHVNGFTGEATRVLRALRALEPNNPRWSYYLADLRLKARDPDEARRLFAETAALAPDYTPVHRQLAQLLLEAGEKEAAARHQALVEKSGGGHGVFDPWIGELGAYCYDSFRLQLLSDAFLAAGDTGGAIAALKRAVQISPGDALFHDLLAAAHEAAGDFESAVAALQAGIKQAPEAFSLHVRLATALCRQQRAPAAVDVVQRALQRWPEQAELHAALGHSLLIARRPAEAVDAFRAAVARNDRLTEAHFNLGNALLQLGRRSEARTNYEQAIAMRPDFADALRAAGVLAIEAEDAPAAERHGTALLALSADAEARRIFAGAQLLKGTEAVQAGRSAAAEQHYRRGLEVDSTLAPLHAGLGMIYASTGRSTEALQAFEAYAKAAPEDPQAYWTLGHAQQDVGKSEEARRSFARGLELSRRLRSPEHVVAFERALGL